MTLHEFEPMHNSRAFHAAMLMTNLGEFKLKTDLLVVVGGGMNES
jgi:hypothetical protein